MIPAKVSFTDFEFEPSSVADRWHRGIIPLDWDKVRFVIPTETSTPIQIINRWLVNNIEGRWAIYIRYNRNSVREVTIAFEQSSDGVVFVLADGKNESIKDNTLQVF